MIPQAVAMTVVLGAVTIVVPGSLDVGVDRCSMSTEEVQIIGSRYLANGADILDICNREDWLGHHKRTTYNLPAGVGTDPVVADGIELLLWCVNYESPNPFRAHVGTYGCRIDHIATLEWIPECSASGVRPGHCH